MVALENGTLQFICSGSGWMGHHWVPNGILLIVHLRWKKLLDLRWKQWEFWR